MHVAAKEMRLKLALEREFLRIDDAHDEDDGDEAEGRDRRERDGERWIGYAGERSDHHILRISGDRRHAAAIGRGRDRDQIGQRIAAERTHHLQHDRRHDETDRVIDQKGRQDARHHRYDDEQQERRMRIFDGERAKRPECAGHLEMRNHDHHAEQKRDRVEVDCAESFLEAQGPDRDHRRAAEESDARAVETQAWNPAYRDADIGQDQNDERYVAFGSQELAAPSIASGWRFLLDGFFVARFRHEAKEDEKRDGRRGAEGKKRDAIAEMVHSTSGRQSADRGADPLRGRDGALREIETAGAAHDVGNDQGCERLIDTCPDAVEQLNSDQPEGVIRQRVKRRADRQRLRRR